MKLPTPDPQHLRGLATSGVRASRELLATVPRITALLEAVEVLVEQLDTVLVRLEQVVVHAEQVVQRADAAREQGVLVLAETEALNGRAGGLLNTWTPMLEQARPLLARFSESWGTDEIDALTATVRLVPDLGSQLDQELIPVMRTLRSVAPDLTELVTTSKALNEIIGAVPGLGRAKQRAEEAKAETTDSA